MPHAKSPSPKDLSLYHNQIEEIRGGLIDCLGLSENWDTQKSNVAYYHSHNIYIYINNIIWYNVYIYIWIVVIMGCAVIGMLNWQGYMHIYICIYDIIFNSQKMRISSLSYPYWNGHVWISSMCRGSQCEHGDWTGRGRWGATLGNVRRLAGLLCGLEPQ